VHGPATATTRDDLWSRAREYSKYESEGGGLKLLLFIHFKAKKENRTTKTSI
jgi:hypothetical protein